LSKILYRCETLNIYFHQIFFNLFTIPSSRNLHSHFIIFFQPSNWHALNIFAPPWILPPFLGTVCEQCHLYYHIYIHGPCMSVSYSDALTFDYSVYILWRKGNWCLLHSYFVFNWLVIHMHVLVFFLSTVLWTIYNHIIYGLINCGRWTYIQFTWVCFVKIMF
jgi:hypothetical protein